MMYKILFISCFCYIICSAVRKILYFKVFILPNLFLQKIQNVPNNVIVNEAKVLSQLNSQVASYENRIVNAQIQTQALFGQLAAGNHEIYKNYLTIADIFSELKQQNSTAKNCSDQYGIAPAVGNYTNKTNSLVESAMQEFELTFNNLFETVETAHNQILSFVENMENCFKTYLNNQNQLFLDICSETAVSFIISY